MLRAISLMAVLTSVLVLLLTGCNDRPPMLTIKGGKQSVLVKQGTYSWRYLTRHVIADSPDPANMIKLPDEATRLAPGTELSLLFGRQPKKMMLSRWEGQKELGQEPLDKNSYTLPTEPGTYLYSIRAEWRQGSSMYAFAVRVE
ncbi:hypothetical protein ACI5FR_12555 [Paenibacillus sp. HJGM_3]